MPVPQEIQPGDSLENGFRVAHNNTAKSVSISADISADGLLTFYGLGNVVLFQLDLTTVLAKRSQLPTANNGQATPFSSATEDQEGTVKLATTELAEAGVDEFTAITPAVLAHILSQRGPAINLEGAQAGQTLFVQIAPDGTISLVPGNVDVYDLGRGFYGSNYTDFNAASFNNQDFFAS